MLIMKIEKTISTYINPLTGSEQSHHVLYTLDHDRASPFDAVNLFLSINAVSSIDTSKRYSSVFIRFYSWYFKYKKQLLNKHAWLTVTDIDIQSWQINRAAHRTMEQKEKPSDKTIFSDACIIHDFYIWALNEKYPVRIKPQSREFIFDFKNRENDLLAHIPKSKRKVIGKKNIRVKTGSIQQENIRILTPDQIKDLLMSYSDPVYAFMYLTSMCTGLRPEGVVAIPYIGVGRNSHILPWDQMKKEIKPDQLTFTYRVTEKGRKTRSIKININDWNLINSAYLSLLEERRNLYKEKNGKYPDQKYFWLNSKGMPITSSKQIADATTYAKKRGNIDFPCCFYDARHWYATMYILHHLNKNNLWKEDGYNAAIDENLRQQLGHENILTTYNHYVSVARLYVAASGGLVSEVAKAGGFVKEIFSQNELKAAFSI